jgi:hypothetical protein
MVFIDHCKEKGIKMSYDVKPWDLLNPNKEKSPEELMEARLEICKMCEFYKAKTNRCGKCNCFMKLKTTLKDAKCPVGKW